MFRKYVIISLAAMMVLGTNACTSKKASDDSADMEQNSGDDSIESADATENNDDLSGDKSSGAVADMGGGDELAPEEKLPSDAGGGNEIAADNKELAPSDLSETPPPGDQAVAQNADATPPPAAATDAPPPGDAAGAPPLDSAAAAPPVEPPMAPPTPEPAMADSGSKSSGSLQKVKTQPFRDHKILANAVYIARDGDTKESISQKVFGSDARVKELCLVNKHNCSRDVKVGDKFYYNSPQRPNDDTVVKTFYEDAGVAPVTYSAKAGDNIRKVGKTLLGSDRSWMELWATNEVESKGDLDEGTQLKYWPNSEAPTQTMAKNEAGKAEAAGTTGDAAAPPPGGDAGPPPPAPDQAAAAPPPVPDQAAAAPPPPAENLPPAPDQNQAAAAGTAEPPPPPPPPPPADTAQNRKEPAAVDASGGMSDPNQTVALAVGAVLLLAAAGLFISIRKKRARRQIDFNTSTQTQIE